MEWDSVVLFERMIPPAYHSIQGVLALKYYCHFPTPEPYSARLSVVGPPVVAANEKLSLSIVQTHRKISPSKTNQAAGLISNVFGYLANPQSSTAK